MPILRGDAYDTPDLVGVAGAASDGVYFTMHASMQRAGSVEAIALETALLATSNFPGVTGVISFTGGSHVPTKGVTVIAVKDLGYTPADEHVPAWVPDP